MLAKRPQKRYTHPAVGTHIEQRMRQGSESNKDRAAPRGALEQRMRERRQHGEDQRKRNRMRSATMPEGILIADAQLERSDIQVRQHRRNGTDE